ncbi:MAG: galactokinase family protein [Vicinamibacteria bacterium]
MTRSTAARLREAGLGRPEAAQKAALFAVAESALGPGRRYWVPGRIEVLGKHTDYAGGRSLLVAAERGFCAVAAPREDAVLALEDAISGAGVSVPLDPEAVPPPSGAGLYAAVVARRLARDFPGPLRGLDLAYASDLPAAAGLSSSAALVSLLYSVIADENRLWEREEHARNLRTREDLASYLGCVENGYAFRGLQGDHGVGTLGGSEDHTAILECRPGKLSRFRFCPVEAEGVAPVPEGCVFAVAVSGVEAEKTGAARERYNRASSAAAAALEAWRTDTGRDDETLFRAATSAPDAPERLREAVARRPCRGFSAEELDRRVEHFLQESLELVPAAGDALAAGDLAAFGAIADRSQAGAERLLGNQIPETIELARGARELGAHAASAFGAGFGGSVWALVDERRAEEFLAAWERGYRRTFRAHAPAFFATGAGPGLLRL